MVGAHRWFCLWAYCCKVFCEKEKLLLLLIFASLLSGQKTYEAIYVEKGSIKLDGQLDSVYLRASPIKDFVQSFPKENSEPSETTYVWIAYDDENMYIFFKCFGKDYVGWYSTWDNVWGDEVKVFLDTFLDGENAYYFSCNPLGVQGDGRVTQNGRNWDSRWDGIWWAETKREKDYYTVEFKIPFKTLRFKSNPPWGINFYRFIMKNLEDIYWVPVLQHEGLLVSKFGKLEGIMPTTKGRFLEVFPVGYIRNDLFFDTSKTYSKGGFDISWSPHSQHFLHLTIFPDFGEIEADPFVLNLSKFRTYYSERRPFFLEGMETFQIQTFGNFNFYGNFEFLHTRNIGKKLFGGVEVPVIIGSKYLYKGKTLENGIIIALTDEKETSFQYEPRTLYFFLRPRLYFGNTGYSLGFFLGGKEPQNSNLSDKKIGVLDFHYLKGTENLHVVLSASDSMKSRGFFGITCYEYRGRDYFVTLGWNYMSENFDMNGIGFSNVYPFFSQGILVGRSYFSNTSWYVYQLVGIGLLNIYEFQENFNQFNYAVIYNLITKNNYSFFFAYSLGKNKEVQYVFDGKNFQYHVTAPTRGGFKWGVGGNIDYSYNYLRNYLGWSASNYFWFDYSRTNLSLGATIKPILELNPENKLEELTLILRPNLSFTPNRRVYFRVSLESLGFKSRGYVTKLRMGTLAKIQLAPKSFLYLALNSLNEREDIKRISFDTEERISVIKLKYLFYF